jgi:hypothetical protein
MGQFIPGEVFALAVGVPVSMGERHAVLFHWVTARTSSGVSCP